MKKEICRNTGGRIKVPLKPMNVISKPMELTAMDVVGPLPTTDLGNKYIKVFSDYLTKWPDAFATRDQKQTQSQEYSLKKLFLDMEHQRNF